MNSFSESQRFRQWWLWAIIIGVNIATLYSAYREWSVSKSGVSMSSMIGMVAFPLILVVFFLAIKLETTIDEAGISYRFFPVHIKPIQRSWDEIDKAYVRQYRPIPEFGGWGIRYSFGNGKALNIAGNMGLQLVFKDGKKVLIGTQQPDEINEILRLLVRSGKITKNMTLPPVS